MLASGTPLHWLPAARSGGQNWPITEGEALAKIFTLAFWAPCGPPIGLAPSGSLLAGPSPASACWWGLALGQVCLSWLFRFLPGLHHGTLLAAGITSLSPIPLLRQLSTCNSPGCRIPLLGVRLQSSLRLLGFRAHIIKIRSCSVAFALAMAAAADMLKDWCVALEGERAQFPGFWTDVLKASLLARTAHCCHCKTAAGFHRW